MHSFLSRGIALVTVLAIAAVLLQPLGVWDRWIGPAPAGVSRRAAADSRTRPGLVGADPDVGMRRLATQPLRGVSVLTLALHGLRSLTTGHYEGWAIFPDGRISTGTFGIDGSGGLVSEAGAPLAAFPLTRDIVDAQRIEITIEPDGDRDPRPSGVTILAGPLVNGRAELAPPFVLAPLAGGFTLMTPTDSDPTNEAAGVWFYDRATREPALALPELHSGWVFEGWVGTQGLTFSTGRFAQAVGPDLAAPFSGARPGLSAPGEDLVARLPGSVRQPVNLRDGASTVAISIEPDQVGFDPTGPAPSGFIVLQRLIPAGAPTGNLLPLDVNRQALPSGVATVG